MRAYVFVYLRAAGRCVRVRVHTSHVAPNVCRLFGEEKERSHDVAADKDKQSKMGKIAPMNRLGEPKEVVATMLMMLSPANTYMTGQCIAVDGGVSAT